MAIPNRSDIDENHRIETHSDRRIDLDIGSEFTSFDNDGGPPVGTSVQNSTVNTNL